MALNIKDPETDRLARRLSTLTGESITTAVKTALRERIEREERGRGKTSVEELPCDCQAHRLGAGSRHAQS